MYHFAAFSDRTDNAFLLQIILDEPLADKISIIEGLKERQDLYFGDIIIGIITHGGKKYQSEYLVRLLLHSLFHNNYSEPENTIRISENIYAIRYLLKKWHDYVSPSLKKELIDLLIFLPDFNYDSLIINELMLLIDSFQKNDQKKVKGDPDIYEELKSILNLLENSKNRDFLEPLGLIIKYVKTEDTVKKAKDIYFQLLIQ